MRVLSAIMLLTLIMMQVKLLNSLEINDTMISAFDNQSFLVTNGRKLICYEYEGFKCPLNCSYRLSVDMPHKGNEPIINSKTSYVLNVFEEGDGNVTQCSRGEERAIDCENDLDISRSGSQSYCLHMGNCRQNSACYCRLGKLINQMHLITQDNVTIVYDEVKAVKMYDCSSHLRNLNSKKGKILFQRDLEDFELSMEDDVLRISRLSTFSNLSIIVRKEASFNLIFSDKQSVKIFLLPEEMLRYTGKMYVDIVSESEEFSVSTKSIMVVGRTLCRISDCYFCWDTYYLWNCSPNTVRLFFAIQILAAILLTVFILYFIFSCCLAPTVTFLKIYGCLSIVNKRRRRLIKANNDASSELKDLDRNSNNSTIMVGDVNISMDYDDIESPKVDRFENSKSSVYIPDNVSVVKRRSSVEESDIATQSDESSKKTRSKGIPKIAITKPRTKEQRFKKPKNAHVARSSPVKNQKRVTFSETPIRGSISYNTALLLMMIGMILSVLGQENCSNGVNVVSEEISCIRISHQQSNCTMKTSVLMSVPLFGTACYNIRYQNSSLGNIYIDFRNAFKQHEFGRSYYTSRFKLSYENAFRCRDAGPCKGDKCEDINPLVDVTAYGQLSHPEVIDAPGITRCDRKCPCISCGCFLCEDGCDFSRFGINPFGDIFEVVSVGDFIYKYDVDVTLEIGATSKTNRFSMTSRELFADDIHLTYDGELSGITNNFPGNYRHILLNTDSVNPQNYASFSSASQIDFPIVSTIGSIQSNNKEGLANYNHNSFKMSQGIEGRIEQESKSVKYLGTNHGFENFDNDRIGLPFLDGGDIWFIDHDKRRLMLNMKNVGPLLFTMTTDKSFSFIKEDNLVCPIARLVSVSGCYKCSSNVVAVIEIKSTCLEGQVTYSLSDSEMSLFTKGSSIKSTYSNKTISFATYKAANSLKLNIYGSGGNQTIDLTFIASLPDHVSNNTNPNTTNVDGDDGGSDGIDFSAPKDFFSSLISGSFAALKMIVFIVIIIIVSMVIVGAVILTGYAIFKVVKLVKHRRSFEKVQ